MKQKKKSQKGPCNIGGLQIGPPRKKEPPKKSTNEKYWDERIKLGKKIGKEDPPMQFEE